MTQKAVHAKCYPIWADPNDVERARAEGLSPVSTEHESWKLCPVEQNPLGRCVDGVWNELACSCFKKVVCMGAKCPAGEVYDPREGCACRDAEELKSELYPVWATDDDIRRAVRASWENAGAQTFPATRDDES